MTRSIPWPRILAEGFAIVVSILLAFGIQAWWEEVQLQGEVRQDLASLSQELVANRAQVVWQAELMERMATGGNAIFARMESDREAQAIPMPDTLVWLGTAVAPRLEASLGALEALIASGRLSAISNPALRASLGAIGNQVDEIVVGQLRFFDWYDHYWMPLVYDELDQAPLLTVASRYWPEDPVPGRPLVHEDLVTLPNTLALRNFISLRALTMSVVAGQMRRLQATMDELLALIAEER